MDCLASRLALGRATATEESRGGNRSERAVIAPPGGPFDDNLPETKEVYDESTGRSLAISGRWTARGVAKDAVSVRAGVILPTRFLETISTEQVRLSLGNGGPDTAVASRVLCLNPSPSLDLVEHPLAADLVPRRLDRTDELIGGREIAERPVGSALYGKKAKKSAKRSAQVAVAIREFRMLLARVAGRKR